MILEALQWCKMQLCLYENYKVIFRGKLTPLKCLQLNMGMVNFG